MAELSDEAVRRAQLREELAIRLHETDGLLTALFFDDCRLLADSILDGAVIVGGRYSPLTSGWLRVSVEFPIRDEVRRG